MIWPLQLIVTVLSAPIPAGLATMIGTGIMPTGAQLVEQRSIKLRRMSFVIL